MHIKHLPLGRPSGNLAFLLLLCIFLQSLAGPSQILNKKLGKEGVNNVTLVIGVPCPLGQHRGHCVSCV